LVLNRAISGQHLLFPRRIAEATGGKDAMNRTHSTRICFCRYRLHVIEQWAESAYRRASLAAVRAALMSEEALAPAVFNEEE
jgi:hypothetical protein